MKKFDIAIELQQLLTADQAYYYRIVPVEKNSK